MTLERSSLWQRLLATTAQALRSGALLPLPTDSTTLTDGSGVCFSVRVLATLQQKDEARGRQDGVANPGLRRNPFLPPEPELTVAPVGDTHLAVLNKFTWWTTTSCS